MIMAEKKGLSKPVKLKADLAELLGAKALPRTEITKNFGTTSKPTSCKRPKSTASRKTPGRTLSQTPNSSRSSTTPRLKHQAVKS